VEEDAEASMCKDGRGGLAMIVIGSVVIFFHHHASPFRGHLIVVSRLMGTLR
jgi:hypothetical protein